MTDNQELFAPFLSFFHSYVIFSSHCFASHVLICLSSSHFFFRAISPSSKCMPVCLMVLFIPFSWSCLRSVDVGCRQSSKKPDLKVPFSSWPSCLFLPSVFLPPVSSKVFKNSTKVETLGKVERKHSWFVHKKEHFSEFFLFYFFVSKVVSHFT